MFRSARAGWFAVITIALLAPPICADERIVRFDSDITINADASLLVTETIEVRAENRAIRRGIFRDFPTAYRDRLNNVIRVRFDVLEVRRNNATENWTIENLRNGVRLRIGRADRMLDAGRHVYTITYRTTRQLGFFDDYDELYWNVTGNRWAFPIDAATATVYLPAGAPILQEAAWTGRAGERGTAFQATAEAGRRSYRTTRVLTPGEGLTIAIAWPKGHVAEPTGTQRLRWFLTDNRATGIALAGTAIVFTYYLLVWRRFGRDPESGTIIPRFAPPTDLSPAAVRFIWLMAFDRQAFSAALIDMAVRGYLSISEHGGTWRLERRADADLAGLSNGERRVAKRLFATGDSIVLDNENHAQLRKSVHSLRESLAIEYERAYFRRNTAFMIPGIALSAGLILLTAAIGGTVAAILIGLVLALVCSAVLFVILHFWGDDRDPTFKVPPFRWLRTTRIMATILQIGFFVVLTGVGGLGAAGWQAIASPMQSLSFALLGSANILFFFLLKRPTLAGRSLMDEIEGFRMYLGAAEEERLNLLNPPDRTPELFEAFLPYALALDVENEWSERFAAVLADADAQRDGGYRPGWYRGRAWRAGHAENFAAALGTGLGSAIASSVTPPGSRSGSAGGGFSGGGGGGGGGGGW